VNDKEHTFLWFSALMRTSAFVSGPSSPSYYFQALSIIVRSCSEVTLEILASVPFLECLTSDDLVSKTDRLCGLVVRILGYSSGGPGSIPGTTRKKVVDLERGPLSLVSTTEELLDRKVAAPVWKTENTAVGIRHADHVAPSIHTSWQSLRRQAAVARSV
jgi:hypothetical protein